MKLILGPENKEPLIQILMALVRWFPDSQEEIKNLIHQVKKQVIQLCVDPLKPDRTKSQENYYRKWAREFGKFTGNTPDEIHEIMLCKTYGSKQVVTRYGVMHRPVQRSSDQSKSSYADLIETLIRESAEMDFIIPPPKPPSPE